MVRSGDFLRVPFFLRKNGHESIDSLYTLREFALTENFRPLVSRPNGVVLPRTAHRMPNFERPVPIKHIPRSVNIRLAKMLRLTGPDPILGCRKRHSLEQLRRIAEVDRKPIRDRF